MAKSLDIGEVLALAPEKKRRDRARKLAAAAKWNSLGREGNLLWGEVPSSGKRVYQVKVNMDGDLGYHCNCPSRETPCKHVVALLMVHVQSPGDIQVGTPPDWAAAWGQKDRNEQRGPRKPKQVNPKTLERRQREIEAGLDELNLWLRDMIRAGLASVQGKPRSFYANPAKRLVDAKAPALAERVRALGDLPGSGEGWVDAMLRELAQIHLIVQGFRRYDKLTPELQADIRSAVGWYVGQNELTEVPTVYDTWFVVGATQSLREKLKTQRLWMYGLETQRMVLLLDFAYGAASFDHRFDVGDAFTGGIVYYPSAYPLRGLVRDRGQEAPAPDELPGHNTLKGSIDAYARGLAQNPWLTHFPVSYLGVIPVYADKQWSVVDEAGDALPLSPGFRANWELFAVSGGRPLWLFGEWNGATLYPLTVSQNGAMIPLQEVN
jgi:hypothetical protein